MKHLIVMCKGYEYDDDKIAIVSAEYPFNTIAGYEKAGWNIYADILILDTKIID